MNKWMFAALAAMTLMVGCSGSAGEAAGTASSPEAGYADQSAKSPGKGMGDPEVSAGWAGAKGSAQNGSGVKFKTVAQLASHTMETKLEREVVKKGSLSVQIPNIDEAERKTRELVEGSGGRVDRVTSENLAGPEARLQMTLRIPVDKFESVMAGIEKLGVRTKKSVEIVDVTESGVDMDARLKVLIAQEVALRNMLTKSTDLSDSLTIKNDITRLRADIESLAAQRKSLAGQAAFSDLELSLEQNATAAAMAGTDPNWMQGSWAQAWGAGTGVFRGLASVLMWLLVFCPIWIPGLLIMRWLIRSANQPKTHPQS